MTLVCEKRYTNEELTGTVVEVLVAGLVVVVVVVIVAVKEIFLCPVLSHYFKKA